MKLDFLCNDGSPLGVSMLTLMGDDPKQVGCGGAELAMLTLCEAWSETGAKVRLYNDPRPGWKSPFEQLPISAFDPSEDRDVLIIFRSPNLRAVGAKGLKVWFSTDQFTIGSFRDFRPLVDRVVCISEYHNNYFKSNYGIGDAVVIDLPVREQDYEGKNIEKVKDRFLFSSVPARGLDIFLDIWPKIKKAIPEASLVITSDYRLWGIENGSGNEQFVTKSLNYRGIQYIGAVPRPRLVEEQLKAELHVYPATYDELFCIAIAESQYAGAYTITSSLGALETTNMGKVIYGDPRNWEVLNEFVKESVLFEQRLRSDGYDLDLHTKAKERFSISRILQEWKNKVFYG
jgi:glycosyltransferase involved in cell wall biosynthesis